MLLIKHLTQLFLIFMVCAWKTRAGNELAHIMCCDVNSLAMSTHMALRGSAWVGRQGTVNLIIIQG